MNFRKLDTEKENIMIAITGTDHIGLYVADARKAANWYIGNLGFKEVGAFKLPAGHSIIFVRSETAGITYEMVQQPAGSPAAAEFATKPGRVDHIAFSVADVEKAFSDAKKAGAEVIEGIVHLPELWKNGYRYFMIKGAGGETVEFGQVL